MRSEPFIEGPAFPLLLRGALLIVAAVALIGLASPLQALGPSLALLVVIAAGAVPLPRRRAAVIQSFAEAAIVGLIIGGSSGLGLVFLPLLLLAVFTTGRRGGLAQGAVGGLVGSLAWAVGVLTSQDFVDEPGRIADPLVWSVLLVAAGTIGGWVRRLTLQNRTFSDSAYSEAFRLLSELQEVSRDLSLGLDPTTLGTSLLDEIGHVVPDSERTLSVRTGEGRLAALVGTHSGRERSEQTTESAWNTAQHVWHQHDDGTRHHAFPVLMGSKVVAVLDVQGAELSTAAAEDVRQLISDIGPKLAAALLFDDVRQLATVDERLRLAREIHDGVAQEVASVGYLLDDLAARVPPDAADDLRSLRDHVRKVTGELRLSIFDLRAGADDSIGLGTALSEHVQRIGQQSALVVHTVLDEHGERLPAGTEVELLRIAQEAVTNVRRHAQASNLWVECTVDAPRAWVRIADDGIGLQPARPQSMGIRGMRERARRIGGELTVAERPGGGTVVEVTVGDWDEETDTT